MNENITENLDWVLKALQFKFGWALGVFVWRGSLGFTYGFVSNLGQTIMEGLIPEDREFFINLFNHRGYRIIRSIIKALTSIQLPQIPRKPNGTNGSGDTKLIIKPPL